MIAKTTCDISNQLSLQVDLYLSTIGLSKEMEESQNDGFVSRKDK